MNEKSILGHISELVDEEHKLRSRVMAGDLSTEEEQVRLRQVEAALDQCWDLLRQRRSAKARGEDPDAVQARPVDEVEGYLQ